MSYDLFWYGDAETYWAYRTAFVNKEKYEQEKENNISWLRGLYIFDALSASLSNSNRTKESDEIRYYMDKPIDFNKNLKEELKLKKFNTNLGDEGGFAPSFDSDEKAIEYIIKAVKKSSLKIGRDINICLDVAANELYNLGKYKIKEDKKAVNSEELINYYKKLCNKFPIVSIEDPVFEDDWNTWKKLTRELGKKIQIVGDDLFVTNPERLQRGIDEKTANALLVKVNQIGSLTETIDAVNLAHKNGYHSMMSHRSGETEDTTIADLAVALNCGQIKTGAPARSERVAKYNQLLRIEEELSSKAVYAGSAAFPRFKK